MSAKKPKSKKHAKRSNDDGCIRRWNFSSVQRSNKQAKKPTQCIGAGAGVRAE